MKNEKDDIFKGIIAPVTTPFNDNDEIDEEKFRKEVKYLLNCDIDGISPGGSTGEGATLSDNELIRLVEIIKEENVKKIPIVCGIIRNSTHEAIKAAKAVKEAGADAIMVTPTFYLGGADNKGNYEFYRKLAEEVGLPIIVYNVIADNEIKPKLFNDILNIENVIGIKQSVGGIQAFMDMKMTCGEKGLIYCATDDMLYPAFDLGADGAIAAIISVFPEYCVKIWKSVKAGDYKSAKEMHYKLYPVWQVIKGPQFQRRVKEAINILGRDVGIAKSPISKATNEESEEIRREVMKL
jgi:4-hydroxy-tetrahydrodipicolinate synthase